MGKILTLILFVVLLTSIGFASENYDEAIRLIQSRANCNELSDNQLEILGDYYMEQMHPGTLHEMMDKRMGGEGSKSLRLIHINMGKTFYCGGTNTMPANMMNIMMNRGGGNMMYNMMGYFGYGYSWFGIILMIIFWIAIIWLIVWIVQQFTKNKESATEILEKRFARGEISKKQYSEMKKGLRR
ncbi:MAG: hypothetical protein AABW57_02560 [Nanoarchaeota archaeon]